MEWMSARCDDFSTGSCLNACLVVVSVIHSFRRVQPQDVVGTYEWDPHAHHHFLVGHDALSDGDGVVLTQAGDGDC